MLLGCLLARTPLSLGKAIEMTWVARHTCFLLCTSRRKYLRALLLENQYLSEVSCTVGLPRSSSLPSFNLFLLVLPLHILATWIDRWIMRPFQP